MTRLFGGRRRKAPKPELPDWLRTLLLEGTVPAQGTPEHDEFVETYFVGSDGIAEAWQKHGARLTEEWVRDHPGSRPHRWWLTEYQPDDDELPAEGESWEAYKARLCGPLAERERETEASTLRRRGLLVRGELVRIPAEDFAPLPAGAEVA